jgi:hypothetical protein
MLHRADTCFVAGFTLLFMIDKATSEGKNRDAAR